jgi:hypothetical protein
MPQGRRSRESRELPLFGSRFRRGDFTQFSPRFAHATATADTSIPATDSCSATVLVDTDVVRLSWTSACTEPADDR